MDHNINIKLAIRHLRNLIKERISKDNTRQGKKNLARINHYYGKIFLHKDLCNPLYLDRYTPLAYGWKLDTGNIPIQFRDEPETDYKNRCGRWVEYVKVNKSISLPYFCDWKDPELTSLHVLILKLKSTGQTHTKDDSKYEDLQFYKDMYKGLEVQFPLLQTAKEVVGQENG